MSKKPNSKTASQRAKLASVAPKNTETQADVHYESAVKPLLWLAIPFVLILIYGYLA